MACQFYNNDKPLLCSKDIKVITNFREHVMMNKLPFVQNVVCSRRLHVIYKYVQAIVQCTWKQ